MTERKGEDTESSFDRLLAKIEPVLAIGEIPIPKLFDPSAGAKMHLRALASQVFNNDVATLEMGAEGESRYTADVRCVKHSSTPCQLSVNFSPEGKLQHIELDLASLDKGTYKYGTDGVLFVLRDEGFVAVGKFRGRILSETLTRYFIY